MKIIISPAKKMNVDTDTLAWSELPAFLEDTEKIMEWIKGLDFAQAQKLWGCNEKIAALNFERFQNMDLRRNLTPALISYEGIQYQYMAPGVFTQNEWDYVQAHLRILSGFYGLLRPLDGVTPYRLEMQAKAAVGGAKDLYDFWGGRLYKELAGYKVKDDANNTTKDTAKDTAKDAVKDAAEDATEDAVKDAAGDAAKGDAKHTADMETRVIVNLASKEYSKCIERFLAPKDRYITCVFGEKSGGKVIQKGTMAKMARGEMVRYMAENNVCIPEQMKEFDRLGYRFCEALSSPAEYVFIKEQT